MDDNLITLVDQMRINHALKPISIKKKEIVKIEDRMFGGMSNKTYLVSCGDEKFVAHVSNRTALKFVKRKYERDALLKLKDVDIVQKPVYIKKTNPNCRVFKYIEGDTLSTINYMDYLNQISDSIKKIHNSKNLFSYDYKPFKFLDFMISGVKEEKDALYTRSIELLNKYREEMENRPLCPCSNDIQPSNLILGTDGKVYVLDFEFAGNNDYLFDLATFGNLNFTDAVELLKVYKPEYTREDLKLLYLWRIFISIQWYLVALKKFELGYNEKLGIDFQKTGLFFLNSVSPLLDAVEQDKLE